MCYYSCAVARIIGMRLCIRGKPPKAPFILVANHISFTDILALCTVSPGCFVSKAEVANWPGLGPLVAATHAIFLRRETREDIRRVNQSIANLLDQGGGILFFPEGTTSDGRDVRPFKSSLFQPAIEAGLPVHCAALAYTTPQGTPRPEKLVALTGEVPFGRHLKRLLSAPGFTAHLRFSDLPFVADNRKQLAVETHAHVRALHGELRSGLLAFENSGSVGETAAEGA
jgi:1-acyl-sn-glycerol-3-phosphate acyltransferase